jgi:hypothetical protein
MIGVLDQWEIAACDEERGMVEHPLSGGVAWNVPSVVAIGKGINIAFLFWLDDKVIQD